MPIGTFFRSLNGVQKLIVAGGLIVIIILFLFLMGIFGKRGGDERSSEGESPPGTISDVQFDVTTGEIGGITESYTTLDEMEGLSITVSFITPKETFGFGKLALRDYVISLGTADATSDDKVTRKDPLAVIIIPRTNATGGTRLITPAGAKTLTSRDITLSGDFNKTDTRVTITLSDPVWNAGPIIIPGGHVFLGIDYTPMDLPNNHQYAWSGVTDAYKPVGEYTNQFIGGGVTLAGEVQDGAGFVVNPEITQVINEELNIQVEAGDIGGVLVIRKQIDNRSRFVISPASSASNRFLGFAKGGDGLKASILGEPQTQTFLDRFRDKPDAVNDPVDDAFISGINSSLFWEPKTKWFNFVVMEEIAEGWVRLGLVSDFEDDGGTTIKFANFPVIHPVHRMGESDPSLGFHKYDKTMEEPGYTNTDQTHWSLFKTYFKFVSPLDGTNAPVGQRRVSICVKRVRRTNARSSVAEKFDANDVFLQRITAAGGDEIAVLTKLKDITDFGSTVFTIRNPVSTPAMSTPPAVTDSSVLQYTYNTYISDGDGMDRPNNDLQTTNTSSLLQCKISCDNNTLCAGISYKEDGNECVLKDKNALNVNPVSGSTHTFYKKTKPAVSTTTVKPAVSTTTVKPAVSTTTVKPAVTALDTKDYETPINQSGNVIRLDRHDVKCENGALNQFKLYKTGNQMQYKYRCVEGIPNHSLGTFKIAPFVTTAANMDFRKLENINVDCGSKPVGSFQLTRRGTNGSTTDWRDISYRYKCVNNDVNSSTCQTKATRASSNRSDADLLTSSDVSCGDNKVITQFKLKKDGSNKFYYEYKCCDPPAVSKTAVKPADSKYTFIKGKDIFGHDLDSGVNVTQGECETRCDNNNACVGFSYNKNSPHKQCYLKKASILYDEYEPNSYGWSFYRKP
jgi:hypothetical protein